MSTQAVLAAFVTPSLAVAGGIAIAAPILIHLLARRRFKKIRWAAMDFLIDAERRNRRRIRMEEWILLALRCLTVALIGLMLARPFFSPASLASRWAGNRRVERVLILDDSYSMGYESQGGSSMARAKEAVARILDMIRAETPDDTVTVLRTSAPETPLVASAFLGEEQTDQLLARMDALQPTQRGLDLAGVFKSVVSNLARDPGILNAVVYLISDFQRVDWQMPDSAFSASPAAPLRDWMSKDRALHAILINVGDHSAHNTALTDLHWQGGPIVAGSSALLTASIANYSLQPARDLLVQTFVTGRPQASRTIPQLAERQTATFDMDIDFPRIGEERVRVELPPDGLSIDNVRHAAADVMPAIRILLVNGEPSADEIDDEAMLLATALRPEGALFSGHEVSVVDETVFEEMNFSGFQLIILANLYRPSEAAAHALTNYVRDGGGVLIFLGDQVDPEAYNALLYQQAQGFLPAELDSVIGTEDAVSLSIIDRLHPAFRNISGESDPLGIRQIPFYGYYSVKLPLDSAPTLQDDSKAQDDADDDGSQTASATRVLAVYSDPDNHPAILEKRFGNGRVILMTSTADKEWNLWSYHPTFLPVMTELVRHLAKRSDAAQHHPVGAPIVLELDPAVFETQVLVRGPAYPAEPESRIQALATDDAGLTLQWDHTETAGVYQFVLARRGGGESIRSIAVNIDTRESDLAMIDDGALKRALGDIPHQYIVGLRELARGTEEAKVEFWRPLLLAALTVLMLEQLLAWRWGRKR